MSDLSAPVSGPGCPRSDSKVPVHLPVLPFPCIGPSLAFPSARQGAALPVLLPGGRVPGAIHVGTGPSWPRPPRLPAAPPRPAPQRAISPGLSTAPAVVCTARSPPLREPPLGAEEFGPTMAEGECQSPFAPPLLTGVALAFLISYLLLGLNPSLGFGEQQVGCAGLRWVGRGRAGSPGFQGWNCWDLSFLIPKA